MNYDQVLEYLYRQLPMFHRIGAAAYKADLKNTQTICELLLHPEKKFRSIHIAGTNGKGSTSHMLASILQTAGYKTGLYTSPHLLDFRERIRINGEMISRDDVVAFVETYREEFEKINPSFFEWTVGLAFWYFTRERVDIAVIETGLGGRLDSTNVIHPVLSIITNIGYDHMQLLGDTLEKIAAEKAGIIKPGVPVVIGEEAEESIAVFRQTAARLQSPMEIASGRLSAVKAVHQSGKLQAFDIFEGDKILFKNLELDLGGFYQQHNILTVIQSVIELRKIGFRISDEHVRTALKSVRSLTGLCGRWQILSEKPLTVCDVAHNADGITEVLEQIRATPHQRLHLVFGAVNDKDIGGILKLLPKDAQYYFCKAAIPRGLDAAELKKAAAVEGLAGEVYSSVAQAFEKARQQAGPDDLIFIGGSTFVVAEAL